MTGCTSLYYHPTHGLYYDPEKVGVNPEDIWLTSQDGTKLHGWYFHSTTKRASKGLVVLFHGNAENLSSHYISMLWITTLGYDYFIFDYRGYGQSEGKPTPEGTILDGKTALKWASEKAKKLPLIVVGQSLGGAIAMRVVSEVKNEIPVSQLTVDSTFASYKSVGADVLSRSWITWLFQPLAYVLLSDKVAPKDSIEKLTPIPLLVIHGDQDGVVSFKFGQKVFDLAKEPKEFWKIPGGRHTDVFWRDKGAYRSKYIEYLSRVLSRKS